MAYPHKWSSISYKSSARLRKHIGQRRMLYRWTTQPTLSPIRTTRKYGPYIRLHFWHPYIRIECIPRIASGVRNVYRALRSLTLSCDFDMRRLRRTLTYLLTLITSAKEVMFSRRLFLCLSVCLFVSNFEQKHTDGFAWNFQRTLAMSRWTND